MRASGFIPPMAIVVSVILGRCEGGSEARTPPSDESATEAVIAVVWDGLDRLRTGDHTGITDACAENVTYFSVEQESLLVGRQTLVEMHGPTTGQTYYDHFDLINLEVRV